METALLLLTQLATDELPGGTSGFARAGLTRYAIISVLSLQFRLGESG